LIIHWCTFEASSGWSSTETLQDMPSRSHYVFEDGRFSRQINLLDRAGLRDSAANSVRLFGTSSYHEVIREWEVGTDIVMQERIDHCTYDRVPVECFCMAIHDFQDGKVRYWREMLDNLGWRFQARTLGFGHPESGETVEP
jgi:limonene-1,2-epoxide hydrolase